MKKAIAIIVIVLVIGGGAYALFHKSDNKKSTTLAVNTTSTTQSSDQSSASTATPAATSTSFSIKANDDSASPTTLNVKKGDAIKVTFNVEQNEVYHGGLEFKSDVVDSQPIKPGSSDTVSFTADKSFDFTPYWYQSSIKKDYLIHVNVQ